MFYLLICISHPNHPNESGTATTNPWHYLDNAGTMDAMSDEDDGGTWTWSDFDTNTNVDGGWCDYGDCSESCGKSSLSLSLSKMRQQ